MCHKARQARAWWRLAKVLHRSNSRSHRLEGAPRYPVSRPDASHRPARHRPGHAIPDIAFLSAFGAFSGGARRVRRADPMHATPGVWISPRPDLRAGRRGSLDVSPGGDGRVVTAPTRASGRAIAPTHGTGPGDANLGVQGFASEENFVPRYPSNRTSANRPLTPKRRR